MNTIIRAPRLQVLKLMNEREWFDLEVPRELQFLIGLTQIIPESVGEYGTIR